jgi:hypothetical protein
LAAVIGDGVDGVSVGDEVLGSAVGGAYAELALVEQFAPKPESRTAPSEGQQAAFAGRLREIHNERWVEMPFPPIAEDEDEDEGPARLPVSRS